MIEKVERLITEINRIHREYSKDYFETGDDWQELYGLKNWYLRDKDGYVGIHIYFKNKSNFYYPWELQLWDKKDVDSNIASHIKYKRGFVE